MKRFCLACDLKDEVALIQAYDDHHKNVWPEIKESLKTSGILDMEIYRTGNRLLMIIETESRFTFEKKAELDEANPIVQKWEKLMSAYQSKIPWATPGTKWVVMRRVFKLESDLEKKSEL